MARGCGSSRQTCRNRGEFDGGGFAYGAAKQCEFGGGIEAGAFGERGRETRISKGVVA